MDDGTLLGLRLDLPQDLMSDRGGVPLPEEDVAEQVRDGIALRPPEVAVRLLACGVAVVSATATPEWVAYGLLGLLISQAQGRTLGRL